jgi:hypothetical protein
MNLEFGRHQAPFLGYVRASLVGLLLACGMCGAMATLGQGPSVSMTGAVASPVAAAKAAASGSVAGSSLYSTHVTQLENGTVVREFSNSKGVVFAVSWQGPVLPDLTELLGSYFKTFKTAAEQARASGRRGGPMGLARDDLVVSSNGRMRDFFGYAYAPALIPTGVSIKDVLQ